MHEALRLSTCRAKGSLAAPMRSRLDVTGAKTDWVPGLDVGYAALGEGALDGGRCRCVDCGRCLVRDLGQVLVRGRCAEVVRTI